MLVATATLDLLGSEPGREVADDSESKAECVFHGIHGYGLVARITF